MHSSVCAARLGPCKGKRRAQSNKHASYVALVWFINAVVRASPHMRTTPTTQAKRDASRQDVAACCRDKLDVACCVGAIATSRLVVQEVASQRVGRFHVKAMAGSQARCCSVLSRQVRCSFHCGLRRKLASKSRLGSAPFKRRVGRVARTRSYL